MISWQLSNWQLRIDSTERLRRISCAFRGCDEREFKEESQGQFCSDCESPCDRALYNHIKVKRNEVIQEVALVEEEYIWDVYKAALAVQERQGIPAAGPAIERRDFEQTLKSIFKFLEP